MVSYAAFWFKTNSEEAKQKRKNLKFYWYKSGIITCRMKGGSGWCFRNVKIIVYDTGYSQQDVKQNFYFYLSKGPVLAQTRLVIIEDEVEEKQGENLQSGEKQNLNEIL